MITNPKIVYKIFRREERYDQRDGIYTTSIEVATCNTPEEILHHLEFDKWMKITAEVIWPASR